MGGDRQDIKGHDSTPPRPCLPLGCAPGRPPESERGAEMMTADELHAEVVKAQRARAAAKVSPQVGWRRGDLPYLARTFTRWELMRALRVVADAKIKDPAKTLRLALEGEWSFPGAGARQAHAPAPSPIPRPLPLIEVERPREHTADERADIERARQLAAAHRARALMLIGGAR